MFSICESDQETIGASRDVTKGWERGTQWRMFEVSNWKKNNKTVSCFYPAKIRLLGKLVFIKDKWSKYSVQDLEKKNCKGVNPKR